ncbi:uncharacterized protein LOC144169477 [Haemaphysalis longicornis]
MNLITCLTFVALATLAYGATAVPANAEEGKMLSKDDQASIVVEVGKRLEALGKVLQGKVHADNSEGRLEITQALQALSDAEGAVDKDSSEYWVGVVIRGVAGGAIAHGIDRWKNRG